MFVSKYEVYTQYHPAEGGIYLHGLSLEESEEFCTDGAVLQTLRTQFYKEVDYYGIPRDSIRVEHKEWGDIFRASDEGVSIIFVYDFKSELVSNYHYDEDYGECEDYSSYVEVEENSPYQDRFCYKYVPESTKGIHERVPFYC